MNEPVSSIYLFNLLLGHWRPFLTAEKVKVKIESESKGLLSIYMSATGGMGRESWKFYAHLSGMISEKSKENYAFIASWIRRKISFALANFTTLQTQTQRIRCLHLQRLAKLHVDATSLSFWVLRYINIVISVHCVYCVIKDYMEYSNFSSFCVLSNKK